MGTRQYNPLAVVGTWAIPIPPGTVDILDGRVNGPEFVNAARDNPRWTRESDGHGNTTRVKNNARGGTLSITLSASSPTNATLSKLAATDELTESVIGPIVLKDLNGNTVIEADGCYLEDPMPATVGFGANRGERTWVFQCSALRSFIGGHDEVA